MGVAKKSTLRFWWLATLFFGFGLVGVLVLAATGDAEARTYAEHLCVLIPSATIWFAIGVALVGLSFVLLNRLRRIRQVERDQVADDLLERLRSDGVLPDRPFFLYLRAFQTTGRLKPPFFLLMSDWSLQRLRTSELEGLINAALSKAGPLVALGEPGENLGAGRIQTTDDSWTEDIALLAHGAKGIALIPSDRPGTLWEIEFIRNERLLDKTVFIMPPASRAFDWEAHWDRARDALGAFGQGMPFYDERGLLFTLNPDGFVRNASHFPVFWAWFFRGAFLKLLRDTDPRKSGRRVMADAKRRGRRQQWLGYGLTATRVLAVAGLALLVITAEPMTPSGETSWNLASLWPWSTPSTPSTGDEAPLQTASREEPEALRRLLRSPAFQDRIDGMTENEVAVLLQELIDKGLSRLDDRRLLDYYAAYGAALSKVDEATCAAIADGRMAPDDDKQAFASIPKALQEAWTDAIWTGALLELEGAPERTLLETQTRAALEQAVSRLTPEEGARLRRVTAPGSAMNPSDACWLLRTKVAAVQSLEEPYNRIWARVLAGGGGRKPASSVAVGGSKP